MLTQFNGMTVHKINEGKKHRRDSLRSNVLEKNHRHESLKELRNMFEAMGINGEYKGHNYMLHQFNPDKADVDKVLGNIPKLKPKNSKREPRMNLKPVPLRPNGMFMQEYQKAQAAKELKALEDAVIKNGKPNVTGSHGY